MGWFSDDSDQCQAYEEVRYFIEQKLLGIVDLLAQYVCRSQTLLTGLSFLMSSLLQRRPTRCASFVIIRFIDLLLTEHDRPPKPMKNTLTETANPNHMRKRKRFCESGFASYLPI